MPANYTQNDYYGQKKDLVNTNTNLFVAKVIGVMFIGLVITALVAGLTGFLFTKFVINKASEELSTTSLSIYGTVLIISAIAVLVLSFVVPIVFMRSKKSFGLLVPTILYVVFLGILLSTTVLAIPLETLAMALGITAFIFGLMALIGILGKGKLNGLGVIISGLCTGALLIYLVSLILSVTKIYTFQTMDYVINYLFFVIVMLITIYDVYNIKRIAARAEGKETNLIIYCAYMLFTDFINIFIRVLLIILRSKKD